MADYVYVGAPSDSALTVINVSNPATPAFAGYIKKAFPPGSNWNIYAIFFWGDYAYFICPNNKGLYIVNVSNPAAPTLVGSIQGAGPPNYLNSAYGIFVSRGRYACVASFDDDALTIFDISNPAAPSHVGSIQGAANFLNGAYNVWVRGNYAYVTAYHSDSLTIIDISNPADPTLVGHISGGGAPNWLEGACDVHVVGNYAYVAAYLEKALTIIDISNPENPTFVGSILRAAPPWLGSARGVRVQGNYAYVISRGDSALNVIDITNPAAPAFVSAIKGGGAPPGGNWLGQATNVRIIPGENYAYVSAFLDNALTIIDISNPSAPALAGSIQGKGAPNFLGQAQGLDTRPASLPSVTTNPATNITLHSATLNGILDDDGEEPCVCSFEWGLTIAYGNVLPTTSQITGDAFSQTIADLLPDTTYHFRAFATNAWGTSYGADRTFTTQELAIINRAYALSRREL